MKGINQLRILVADDNQTMRAACKEILETRDNIIVAGMASDGLEPPEKSAELVPDVAILDVRMPNMDGLAVANRIMAQDTPTVIVLVSAYDDLAFICAIMHSGAERKADILKNSLDNIAEFIRVVEAVAKGQSVLHKTIIQRLMDIYHRLGSTQATQLTDAEERVLLLMLEGYEVEIAQARQLQPEQVESLVTEMFSKLGIVPEEGVNRSPQVVQAMVNICVA
jgi:DNA-binding NarL/FixJ family response regulator